MITFPMTLRGENITVSATVEYSTVTYLHIHEHPEWEVSRGEFANIAQAAVSTLEVSQYGA